MRRGGGGAGLFESEGGALGAAGGAAAGGLGRLLLRRHHNHHIHRHPYPHPNCNFYTTSPTASLLGRPVPRTFSSPSFPSSASFTPHSMHFLHFKPRKLRPADFLRCNSTRGTTNAKGKGKEERKKVQASKPKFSSDRVDGGRADQKSKQRKLKLLQARLGNESAEPRVVVAEKYRTPDQGRTSSSSSQASSGRQTRSQKGASAASAYSALDKDEEEDEGEDEPEEEESGPPAEPVSEREFEQLLEQCGLADLEATLKKTNPPALVNNNVRDSSSGNSDHGNSTGRRRLNDDDRNDSSPGIALAVSGGVDSIALTLLLHRWASSRDIRVTGLTVDHALRRESAAEADLVSHWLDSRSIGHVILKAAWTKPGSKGKVQVEARRYRYSLLSDWCERNGVGHVFTAHHADDLLETFFLRLAHGSGLYGLAGIQPNHRLTKSLTAHRPLLTVPKERLVATCNYFGQPWAEDPSNKDVTYQRNRVRHAFPDLLAKISRQRLQTTVSHFQQARAVVERQVEKFLESVKADRHVGYCAVRKDALLSLPMPVAVPALLSLCVFAAGQSATSTRRARLRRALESLGRDARTNTVVGGCIIATNPSDVAEFLICKEADNETAHSSDNGSAAPGAREGGPTLLPLRDDGRQSWQGRLDVHVLTARTGDGGDRPQLFLRKLKADDWRDNTSDVVRRIVRIPPQARANMPVVVDQTGKAVAFPTIGLATEPWLRCSVKPRSVEPVHELPGL